MIETVTVIGMVISYMAISEYDKRLVEVQEKQQVSFLQEASQWLLVNLPCTEEEMHIR